MDGFYGTQSPNAIFDIPAFQYGSESLLAPFRAWLSGTHHLRAVPVPRAQLAVVPALGQIEDQITLPDNSWLVALSGASDQAAGFRYRVDDAAGGLSYRPITGAAGAQATTDADPVGHILPEPYLVIGRIHVIVNNLATVAADMQLLLYFAVPQGVR